MVNNKGEIVFKNIINNKYILLKIKIDEKFKYIPGQYLILKFNEQLRRSYSIASFDKNIITIAVKIDKGLGAQSLLALKVGNIIEFLGPFGNFYLRESKNNIFIATGIGITPIKGIIDHAVFLNNIDNIKLFWGMRKFEDEIFDFSFLKGKYLKIFSQEESASLRGYVIDHLIENLSGLKKLNFYICGNPDVVNNIKLFIENNLMNIDNIYTEKF